MTQPTTFPEPGSPAYVAARDQNAAAFRHMVQSARLLVEHLGPDEALQAEEATLMTLAAADPEGSGKLATVAAWALVELAKTGGGTT